jgi:hypothetical protein
MRLTSAVMAGSRGFLKPLEHFPPWLACPWFLDSACATLGDFGTMPFRNVLRLHVVWEAIPDLVDKIQSITNAQSVNAERIHAYGHGNVSRKSLRTKDPTLPKIRSVAKRRASRDGFHESS